MMHRLRAGLPVLVGSGLILLACGIKGPPRPPVAPPPPTPEMRPLETPPGGPLEPITEPTNTVRQPGVPEDAPAPGTVRELPPDGEG